MFSPKEVMTQNPGALYPILVLIVIGIVALIIKEILIPLLASRIAGAVRTKAAAARRRNLKSK
jgi:hypothetical protein